MVRHALILLAACSSSPSQTQPTTPVAATPPPIDAATAPPIDAADTELLAAPPSVFRFHATGKAPRLETWTLRHVGDRAQIVVDRMNPAPDAGWTQGGSTIYLGTASDDGATLALALTAGPNKLALAC